MNKIMKTLTLEVAKDIFNAFTLSNEEMICVRGGEATEDPTLLPNKPPVII